MGYWGWRPLVFCAFMSVWIVGCTDTHQTAPTAPATNHVPLTIIVHTPAQPTESPPPGLPVVFTPASQPTTTNVIQLELPQPTCYEAPDGSILCLGYVENTMAYPVRHVALQVSLYDTDGVMLDTAAIIVEQRIIPASSTAPYRAVFPADGDYTLAERFGMVVSRQIEAERSTQPAASFEIETDRGAWEAGRYIISTRVRAQTSGAVRVVATLFDDARRVMGYRIVESHPLAIGEALPLQLAIHPQMDDVPLSYTLHIEALK
jgi:hypothetical protein